MTAEVIVATVGAGFAFVGLLFAAFQIRGNTKAERARFFKDLYDPFWNDPRLRRAYSLIDSRQPLFSSHFGTAGPDDPEYRVRQEIIETLLSRLDLICRLHDQRLISDKDMKFFAFNIERVALAPGFGDYQAILDSWRRERGLSAGPYENLFRYLNSKQQGGPERTATI